MTGVWDLFKRRVNGTHRQGNWSQCMGWAQLGRSLDWTHNCSSGILQGSVYASTINLFFRDVYLVWCGYRPSSYALTWCKWRQRRKDRYEPNNSSALRQLPPPTSTDAIHQVDFCYFALRRSKTMAGSSCQGCSGQIRISSAPECASNGRSVDICRGFLDSIHPVWLDNPPDPPEFRVSRTGTSHAQVPS